MMVDDDYTEMEHQGVDVIIRQKNRKRLPLPKGWTLTWWYLLSGLFEQLKPQEIKLFCYIAANVRSKNIARVSKVAIQRDLGFAKNHLASKLKKLREKDAVIEIKGKGFFMNPVFVWCGKADDYDESLAEWNALTDKADKDKT